MLFIDGDTIQGAVKMVFVNEFVRAAGLARRGHSERRRGYIGTKWFAFKLMKEDFYGLVNDFETRHAFELFRIEW